MSAEVVCPHCRAAYDASHRMSGDRVYCRHCGQWFQVWHRDGWTELAPCDAPASWPKERRRKEQKS